MSNASNMDLAPQLSVEVVAVYEQADGQARVLHRTRRQAHSARERHVDYVWPLPNVLLGVTCEDQQRADERIPILLQYPAAVRWVSAEPQLTSIDFTEIALPDELAASARLSHACVNALTDQDDEHFFNVHAKLDWIVVGGETGEGRRECEITAIEDVARQCGAAGARSS